VPVWEPLLQLEERVKKRRRARRNATLFTQIELSGLLAVCVVLLIVFLVSPSPPHHSLPVDLAAASHALPMPDAQKEDAITVMIARDGALYFRNYRSEEHTSELQSLTNIVCRLLLEKKNTIRRCHG